MSDSYMKNNLTPVTFPKIPGLPSRYNHQANQEHSRGRGNENQTIGTHTTLDSHVAQPSPYNYTQSTPAYAMAPHIGNFKSAAPSAPQLPSFISTPAQYTENNNINHMHTTSSLDKYFQEPSTTSVSPTVMMAGASLVTAAVQPMMTVQDDGVTTFEVSITTPYQPAQHDFHQAPSSAVCLANIRKQTTADVAAEERARLVDEAIYETIHHITEKQIRETAERKHGLVEDEHLQSKIIKRGLIFHPGSSKYNMLMFFTVLLTIFGFWPLMHQEVLFLVFIAVNCIYIIEYLGFQSMLFAVLSMSSLCIMGALVLTNFHYMQHGLQCCLSVGNACALTIVVSMIIALQNGALQTSHPKLVYALEKLMLLTVPIILLPSLYSICLAFCGSRIGWFPFSLTTCAVQYFFATKMESSFVTLFIDYESEDTYLNNNSTINNNKENNNKSTSLLDENNSDAVDTFITQQKECIPTIAANGKGDAAFLTILTVVAPLASFLCITSSQHKASMIIMSMVTMISVHILYLLYDPNKTLWFIKPEGNSVDGILYSDPLGLWSLIEQYQYKMLCFGGFLALEGLMYRILHSRYAYLFQGVPSPWNVLMLFVFIMLCVVTFTLMIRVYNYHNKNPTAHQFTRDRVLIAVLSVTAAVILAIVMGMPGIFMPISGLAAMSFNIYMLDRTNGATYVMFCFFSTLLLIWWMQSTFSVVYMDLKILSDGTVISTATLTGSILWCYLLGAITFGFSFNEEKKLMVMAFFLLGMQLAFVEHVLYSQRDAQVYPGVMVFGTTALGIFAALKMHENGLMGFFGTSCVVGNFMAKIYTFLCEEASIQYLNSGQQTVEKLFSGNTDQDYKIMMLTFGWCFAMAACICLTYLELKRREKIVERHKANTIGIHAGAPSATASITSGVNNNNVRYVFLYGTLCLSAFIFAYGTLTRSFVDLITNHWQQIDVSIDTLVGGALILTVICTAPAIVRYTSRNFFTDCMTPFMIGVGLIVVHPLSFLTESESLTTDVNTDNYAPIGRGLLFIVCTLTAVSQYVVLPQLLAVLRYLYWGITSILGCLALYFILHPAASITFVLVIFVFITLTFIVIDMAHYHIVNIDICIIYGLSVMAIVIAFLATQINDLQSIVRPFESPTVIWQMYSNLRMVLFSTSGVTNMLLAVLIKFRLTGRPLFPKAIKLTLEMTQYLAVVNNYATILGVSIMMAMNTWIGDMSIPKYLCIITFLLLLNDDRILFSDLHKGLFRYFPLLIAAVGTLWALLACELIHLVIQKNFSLMFFKLFTATIVLPSHISLIRLLWRSASPLSLWKKGKNESVSARQWERSHTFKIKLFILLDLLCLLLAGSSTVWWMAAVGIIGQGMMLYNRFL